MKKIIEIRSGAGGEEAELFTEELFKMYAKYAQSVGAKVELVSDFNPMALSVEGKPAILEIFDRESGVHRVQRVPKTDKKGRVQTSTCTVAVLTVPEESEVKINEKELRFDYFRSSGNGGQHRNTTDSAVRLTHIPTGMVVTSVNERSQHKNKALAICVMHAKLVALKKEESFKRVNGSRSEQVGRADRAESKRTYNFQRSTVVDEETGKSASLKEILNKGKLELLY